MAYIMRSPRVPSASETLVRKTKRAEAALERKDARRAGAARCVLQACVAAELLEARDVARSCAADEFRARLRADARHIGDGHRAAKALVRASGAEARKALAAWESAAAARAERLRRAAERRRSEAAPRPRPAFVVPPPQVAAPRPLPFEWARLPQPHIGDDTGVPEFAGGEAPEPAARPGALPASRRAAAAARVLRPSDPPAGDGGALRRDASGRFTVSRGAATPRRPRTADGTAHGPVGVATGRSARAAVARGGDAGRDALLRRARRRAREWSDADKALRGLDAIRAQRECRCLA